MNSTQCVCSGFPVDPSSEFIWIPLAVQLIATLIGALVGFNFVMLWDRKKKRDEINNIKNQTIISIIEELKTVKKEIIDTSTDKAEWHPTQRYFSGTRIHVITPAFDSATHSGHFSLLDQSLQTALGYVYLRIRNCESYNDQIDNFYFTPVFVINNTTEVNRIATSLVTKFNDHMESLKKEIMPILSKLESAKIKKKASSNVGDISNNQ